MTGSDFIERPLVNRTVLVARPRHQAGDLAEMLISRGANVVFQAAIEIDEPDDWEPVDQAISRIGTYDWIVFSSSNGVDAFLGRIQDPQVLVSNRLASIGPGTAARIQDFGLSCELMPETFRAESLAEVLSPHVEGRRVLLIRASRGREVLAESLRNAGAVVEQVIAYVSRDVELPDPEIEDLMFEGDIDWIAITSSSIARSLTELFGESLMKTQLATVSPITEKALQECGFDSTVVAKRHDMIGLVDAICSKESKS
jgi:uroporphyrinogen III methyltransferase / synthase